METIEIVDKNECCGCSSCVQKCPKKAIEMVQNEEGFLYPKINKNKCINCGLCCKVCPQLKKIKKAEEIYPKAYAMINKNKEQLKQSSSGGIFSVVADYVLDNNGCVFGAAYNKNLDVNHIQVNDKENLIALMGSKYVQSNINNTYEEAEKNLKNGKMVLFSGTPCQIAGLKSFLVKEYDNLITCDIVCHGVPSQKLFHTYIDYLSDKYKSKIKYYNFRSKEKKGWGLVSKIETEDGKIRYVEPDFDPYYSNFLESTTYRMSCYNCHYANYDRVSDITLADYWGIFDVHPNFCSSEGNSLILINNNKGEKILKKIMDKIEYIPTNIDIAAGYNKNLIKPSEKSKKRDCIYNGIMEKSSKDFINENLKVKITAKKIMRNIIPKNIKTMLKKSLKKMKGIIK